MSGLIGLLPVRDVPHLVAVARLSEGEARERLERLQTKRNAEGPPATLCRGFQEEGVRPKRPIKSVDELRAALLPLSAAAPLAATAAAAAAAGAPPPWASSVPSVAASSSAAAPAAAAAKKPKPKRAPLSAAAKAANAEAAARSRARKAARSRGDEEGGPALQKRGRKVSADSCD